MLHLQVQNHAPTMKIAAWSGASAGEQASLWLAFGTFIICATIMCRGLLTYCHAAFQQSACCVGTQAVSAQQHISVSRTVALRYTQVEEVVGSLRHRLRKLSRCLPGMTWLLCSIHSNSYMSCTQSVACNALFRAMPLWHNKDAVTQATHLPYPAQQSNSRHLCRFRTDFRELAVLANDNASRVFACLMMDRGTAEVWNACLGY